MIEARTGGDLISTRTIFELERSKVIILINCTDDKSAVDSFCPPQFCLSPNSNLRRPASRPAAHARGPPASNSAPVKAPSKDFAKGCVHYITSDSPGPSS